MHSGGEGEPRRTRSSSIALRPPWPGSALSHGASSSEKTPPATPASATGYGSCVALAFEPPLEPPFAPDVQDAVVVDPSELELPPDPDDGEAVWDPAFAAFGPLVSVGSELAC